MSTPIFFWVSFSTQESIEKKIKIELKPTGGRDDGWTEWRKESVIISEWLAESAFANVAKVTPLSSETACGSAEIQKWRKWSPDVIGCQWRTVGRPISLLRFRNVHFQCRLNSLRSHDYLFFLSPALFPYNFHLGDGNPQFICNNRRK